MRKRKLDFLPYSELLRRSKPQNVNEPEALRWVLFDTATFTSGTTVRQEFFTTLQTNKSLGNLDLAGQLTSGEFFMVDGIGLDIITPVSTAAGGTAGALDDINKIIFGDAGTGADAGRFTFSMLSKTIGPFPLSFLHASGGPTGFGWGTFTAEESLQYANNGIFDGGFDMGDLIIPPTTTFSVVLEWGGTVTVTANPALRVWLYGTKYRPIR